MTYWGITALNHGSSVAVFNGHVYYQYVYSDDRLTTENIDNIIEEHGSPERVYWYERPWVKKCRQLYAGQYTEAFDLSVLPRRHLLRCGITSPITYTSHHASHAAAGYYTSPYDSCAVLVLDAIGEFESATIWRGDNNKLEKLWSSRYPNSLGLFYSAFTHLCGLQPIKDEGKLEQLSHSGDPQKYYEIVSSYITDDLTLTRNLHTGVYDWPYEINTQQEQCDVAAAVQLVFEKCVVRLANLAKSMVNSENLVYMGGCAMNRGARKLIDYENIWSLPNSGDPTSSIGAVAYHLRHKIYQA